MHSIDFVDDDHLPEGHDFLFVAVPDGGLIFYRESAVSPTSLEDSWAAYRALQDRRPIPPATLQQDRSAWLSVIAG